MFRIGLGQDGHPFAEGEKKPLILGGVLIPSEFGLNANSDGDVVLHALFNAFSSAIGKESIGIYADPMCLKQGIIDSKEYLKVALKMVSKVGYKVNNISLAVEAKKPRVPRALIGKMKKKIAKLVEIPKENVGITFTSGEGLTAFGRGEGIQVLAFISLIKDGKD